MNNEDRSHKSAEGKIGTQVGDRKEKKYFERNANTQKEQESLLEGDREIQVVKDDAIRNPVPWDRSGRPSKGRFCCNYLFLVLQGVGGENEDFFFSVFCYSIVYKSLL